jgi:hypothetical protein
MAIRLGKFNDRTIRYSQAKLNEAPVAYPNVHGLLSAATAQGRFPRPPRLAKGHLDFFARRPRFACTLARAIFFRK